MYRLVLLAAVSFSGVSSAVVPRCKLGGVLDVSCIALGTLHMNEVKTPEAALAVIQNAMSLGITTFDLSDVYGMMPQLFGAAIQLDPGLRDQIQVVAKMDILFPPWTTSFGFDASSYYDTSAAHLNAVLETYLAALNTTYVDVLMFHRQDYLLNVTELLGALAAWQQAGTVRFLGASNFDVNTFALCQKAGLRLIANEIELSVLKPDAIVQGVVSYHYSDGSTVLAWGPLGGDPYSQANRLFRVGSIDSTTRTARIRAGLSDVGAVLGDSPDVIAVAWLLRHPAAIIPILGTMNPERLANQTRAVALAQAMTREQWYHIADAARVPIW
jgi:predicted oxidoreductase